MDYKGGKWHKFGLTNIDYAADPKNKELFFMAFYQAAKNADTIRFELSNFNSALNKTTSRELRIIKGDKELYEKTRFFRNGDEYKYNGNTFEKL